MRPSSRLQLLRAVETSADKAAKPSSAIGTEFEAGRPAEPRRLRGPAATRLVPFVEDRDFMPPALGLAETPQSPIRIALMLAICLLTLAAAVWSWFGRIDVLATARGVIEPIDHVQILQPAEGGKISDLDVSDGQVVAAGQVLVRLDPRIAAAEFAAAQKIETAARAEAERRADAIAIVRSGCATCWREPGWSDDIPEIVRQREREVLRGDLEEVNATLMNLADQQKEKAVAIAQSELGVAAQKRLLATLKERVDMRALLVANNVGSRAAVIDATQSVREAETQLVAEQGRHELAVAALASITSERQRAIGTFLADQNRKMSEAQRLAEEKAWERARAQARLDQTTLRAPISGTVQNLTVTTRGQVVVAGQELLRIVPVGDRLVIRAYVSNEDIGFIKPGQLATTKVDAFPFTRFGTLTARVSSVSQDAVPAATANETLVDHSRTKARFDQALTPSAQPMSDLLFATTLEFESKQLSVDGESLSPRPGMTVGLEIKTGSRRIIDYILSPLTEVKAGAFHER